MYFTRLSLFSQQEQSAYQVEFHKQVTILRGGNSTGKSAIIKSLYETLGAQPQQVDKRWKDASVVAALDFRVGDQDFLMIKQQSRHLLFDAARKLIFEGSTDHPDFRHILAGLFNFKLVIRNRDGIIESAPPSYAFAPFYIDQDQGWRDSWSSFQHPNLPNRRATLAEYHTGIKPNEYYENLAVRDEAKFQLNGVGQQRSAVDALYREVGEIEKNTTIVYELKDFENEISELVRQSTELSKREALFRGRVHDLVEQQDALKQQLHVIGRALSEMNSSFLVAAHSDDVVECPMCGAGYKNQIAEQFALIANEDGLIRASLDAKSELKAVEERLSKNRLVLTEVSFQIQNIKQLLTTRKDDIEFKDIVAAESRIQTRRMLKEKLDKFDERIARLDDTVYAREGRMRAISGGNQAQKIREEFATLLRRYATSLNVDPFNAFAAFSVTTTVKGRGSERPRALLALYYATLHIARQYGSPSFCPIVLDAPNQQGQDDKNMPSVMRFIVQSRPHNSQMIIATEKLFGVEPSVDIDIVETAGSPRRLLRSQIYEKVAAEFRPLLGSLF